MVTEHDPIDARMSTLEAAFQSVATKMGDLANSIGGLVSTIRKDRRVTRLLMVSVALDLLLSIGFFYLLHRTNDATHSAQAQADANAAVLRSSCNVSNAGRADAIKLWVSLVDANPAQSPAEQAQQDKILAQVRQVYAPKPCP